MWNEPPVSHRGQGVVAYTVNPSTREVEIGRKMSGQREEYKAKGDRSSIHSV